MNHHPIFMDNNSTTRVDPRVVEAMLPYFTELYGNASSVSHSFGQEAGQAVELARSQTAQLLNASPKSIIFTSGATEANNLALKGVLGIAKAGSHLIINDAEHKAILDPANDLERQGVEVTVLNVDQFGMLTPDKVEAAIKPNTVLISTMYANNEVGTLNPIKEIGQVCRSHGILFHCDAAQALGSVSIDLERLPVDLMSLSAHKIYGPKGIGALYIRQGRPRINLAPQIHGGGHERRYRSGTLPVASIVGFGAACSLLKTELQNESNRVEGMRNRLLENLKNRLTDLTLNGHPIERLSGNANVIFPGINSEALMLHLKDIVALSSGSACTSAEPEPSHVLKAMGVSEMQIESSIRFGIGRFNSEKEIDIVSDAVSQAVRKLQKLN